MKPQSCHCCPLDLELESPADTNANSVWASFDMKLRAGLHRPRREGGRRRCRGATNCKCGDRKGTICATLSLRRLDVAALFHVQRPFSAGDFTCTESDRR